MKNNNVCPSPLQVSRPTIPQRCYYFHRRRGGTPLKTRRPDDSISLMSSQRGPGRPSANTPPEPGSGSIKERTSIAIREIYPSIPKPEGGKESWRDTSKWDTPEEELLSKHSTAEDSQWGAMGFDGSREDINEDADRRNYIDRLLLEYRPPSQSRFITSENIDEISTAILALKEGRLTSQQFNHIVDANLPLPPKGAATRGSGRYGDLFLGDNAIEESMASFLGAYLAGKVQSYDPINQQMRFHKAKTDGWKIGHDPDMDKFNSGWYVQISDRYSRGGFATKQAAQDWIDDQNSGKPAMDKYGPEVGGGYYQTFPETYELLISEFRKDPTRLLKIALHNIETLLQEDKAALDDLMEYYGPKKGDTRQGRIDGILKRNNIELELKKKNYPFRVIEGGALMKSIKNIKGGGNRSPNPPPAPAISAKTNPEAKPEGGNPFKIKINRTIARDAIGNDIELPARFKPDLPNQSRKESFDDQELDPDLYTPPSNRPSQ